jgi:hypothetical protein
MKLATLDTIVRRGLIESGLPMHYYLEYMVHSATCLRELSFDTLKIVNTVHLPVNDYGAVDLPDDFVDDVAVSLPAGTTLQPLPHQEWINPIRTHNGTTGQFSVPHNNAKEYANSAGADDSFFWGSAGWLWYWNVNDFGEPTGRFFGAKGGTQRGYKVIKERRQIQMSFDYSGKSIVLQYISDGQSIDNASQIDTQAIQCIRAWQEWKRSPGANNDYSAEAISFYNRKKQLRSRLSGLTLVDVKNALHQGYTAAVKN